MASRERTLGEKVVSGKNINLDEEDLENLNQMSKSLKQIENNIKENISSRM